MSKFNAEQAILVTGASRGIGRAIAELLKQEGATVLGTYLTGEEEAEHLSTQGIRMLRVDLADDESLASFLDEVRSIASPLYGVVNNAGAIDFALWSEFDFTSWRNTFAVNVDAPVRICHGLRNTLVDGGAVVNIASTDGFTGTFASMAYSSSKAALVNVTKSLGNVFGSKNVRVNAIAPGWVDTGMSTEASYSAAATTPLGRNGRPDDIAAVASFLLSDAARFVTGSAVVVDGGYTNVDVIMKQENDDLAAESS